MSDGKDPPQCGAGRFSAGEVANSAENGLPPSPDVKQPVERPAVSFKLHPAQHAATDGR
jgi:hypothetical protein